MASAYDHEFQTIDGAALPLTTFKDRVVMEQDPYALVEALTIAGFATGAATGYVYIRGEYPLATQRLEHAIEMFRLLRGGSVDGGLSSLSNTRLAILPGATHIDILTHVDLLLPVVSQFLDAPIAAAS